MDDCCAGNNGKGIKYTTETIKRKQGKQFGA